MRPKEVVDEFVRLFNRHDAEQLSRLYHFDAINHQVNSEPVVGNDAIFEMFKREFASAEMVCIPENIFEDGNWAILEWKDPNGLRGCGFFYVINDRIAFQRGYWDQLTFLRKHGLPIPKE